VVFYVPELVENLTIFILVSKLEDAINLREELVQNYPNSSDSYVHLGNA
jgi:hypothetical protein|tara:strand:- start:169 stop:315 length:147 start_codon:yes stop_codon:yes gene_type:complete